MTLLVAAPAGWYEAIVTALITILAGLLLGPVSRALARNAAPSGTRQKRGSKLDGYKKTVDRLLAEGVWNAVVIFRELQAKGYTGQISVLRDYIRPKRTLES